MASTTEPRTLLERMARDGASDLHMKVGAVPSVRIGGEIHKLHDFDELTPERMREFAIALMDDSQRARFESHGDLDFSHLIPGVARFRINVLRQRAGLGLVARCIPLSIPTGDKLGLPVVCRDLALKPRGLVLVTGPTGSGKTTTLAAMIDYINTNFGRHILTIEDPVEFVHRDKKGIITQREIGDDCDSFSQALRRALRQDPDIIMIGEMRDPETVMMALTAAETGHLVFGTLHTTSASQTVDRIIDAFPPEAQEQARTQVANTLQGVISQSLVQTIDGQRTAVHEILVATDAVRAVIREGKTSQLVNQIQTGKGIGMRTLEDALNELVRDGRIGEGTARAFANRPENIAPGGVVKARSAPDVSPQATE